MQLALLSKDITDIPADDELMQTAASDRSFLIYLILGMIAAFITMTVIVILWERAKKKKTITYYNREEFHDRFMLTLYNTLLEFPLTRSYTEKMSYRYRFISPCDRSLIARRTVASCIITWLVCIIIFWIIYLRNPSLNTLMIAAVGVYAADSLIVGNFTKYFKLKVDKEIEEKLLANVIHNYYVKFRVDDAIFRSLDMLSKDMKVAAKQIYELLLSDDREAGLREYYENVPNKFLRAFAGQCITVMERGDEERNGKHLFVRNLECMQREIDIEVEKQQRINMEFAGVLIAVVAPIFCLDYIKHFAVSIKETMDTFYFGKTGFLCDMVFIAFTMCIYTILKKNAEFITFQQSDYRILNKINRISPVKKAMDNYIARNASKQEKLKRELRNLGSSMSPRLFILRSLLYALAAFVLGTGILSFLHYESKKSLLTVNAAEVESLTSSAREDQYEKMGQVIEVHLEQYTENTNGQEEQEIPDTEEEMTDILQREGTFYNNLINQALAKEILKRTKQYNKEYFSFIDLCVCLMLGVLSYYLPWILMKYHSAASREAMEDEVNQFKASISMLMYNDGITPKAILEEMESFAVVFKQSLRSCINDYNSGDREALQALIEREPYESFVRIVENLMLCDEMPIDQAFIELDTDRDGYISKRKLSNEKAIRRRVNKAMLLAVLPILLLLAYGVFPPMVSSMNEINSMMEEMNTSW